MKVALHASTGDRCGIAAYTRDLMAALAERVEVDFVPIQVGKQEPAHYREVADRLNHADVVHIQHEHSFWGGILPKQSAFWVLRYLIEKPLVVTAHTTTSLAGLLRVREERRPLHRLAKRLLLMRKAYRDSVETAPFITSRCIVHTEAARQELIGRGARPEYVHTIPAGVPKAAISTSGGEAFRAKHRLEGRRVVALFGYIAPNKGYELALDAMQELPPDVVLVIAGGPRTEDMRPYAESVAARVKALGLEPRVIITGYLDESEVAEVMAAADVVAVPHTQATGSYSVMIALAHGRPTLASDLPCFSEIHQRVPCLRLFRVGDRAHYAACLKAVLNNELGRAEMAERARRYADLYGWPSVAEQTIAVYEQAIADEERLPRRTMFR